MGTPRAGGPRRYRAFGLVLESAIPLPGLPAARGEPSVRIRRAGRAGTRRRKGRPWRTVVRGPGGRPWMALAREGDRRLLRVRGIGTFDLAEDGSEIRCAPAAGVHPGVLRRVLLDQVLPRALHLAGLPVLHGSAVAGPHGALVFLGESGAGKSSLAALLAVRGLPLLADDGVRLAVRGNGVRAHPSHPLLRLRGHLLARLPKGLRGKAAREPGHPPKWTLDARDGPLRFAGGTVPVHRVLILTHLRSRGYAIDTRPVPVLEAALELLDATFRADPWDFGAFARDLRTLGEVAARSRVHRLRVPRSLSNIPLSLARHLAEL